MQKFFTRKIIVSAVLGLVTAFFITFGVLEYLTSHGTLCLARTEVEPKRFYRTDTERFLERIREVRTDAQTSLKAQFEPETGFFIYEMNPQGEQSDANNDIRQLLASRILAQDSVESEEVTEIHRQNLEAIMSAWYREEEGLGYVYVDEKSKLGANAMLLRTLVASPYFDEYSSEAEALMRGIASIQFPNGSFEAWFKEPSYEFDEAYLLTFYSGEAILALLEYYDKSGNETAYGMAVRAQDFYIEEYVTRMDANYYPAYVPWHTLSLAMLYDITGDTKYVDAIMVMTDKLLEMQDTKEFIGRFFNPETPEYGSPHVSSDAVYTEGLAVAYHVAKKSGDSEREKIYTEALIRAFHNIEGLQFKARWYDLFDDREVAKRLSGGFVTNACANTIRIDSTAHAIDALDRMKAALTE